MKIKELYQRTEKTKALSLIAGLLAFGGTVCSAGVANAATFGFSFENVEGFSSADGTAVGEIELPDAALTIDGNYTATSITILSAPASLGLTFPLDVFTTFSAITVNSFDVVGGIIQPTSSFVSDGGGPDVGAFSLNENPGFGTLLAGPTATGMLDANSSTLTYTSPESPESVPEPASIIGLLSIGALGLGLKGKKKV